MAAPDSATTVRPTEDEKLMAGRMRGLLYGRLLSTGLCAVARLGVPDLLADGPRSVGWLAARCGAQEGSLLRLLRDLAAFDVFVESADGTFETTALGRTLAADFPGSARPTALLVSAEVGEVWSDLARTVRTGESPFRHRYGRDFFAYLHEQPELQRTFDESQAAGLALEIDEVLGALRLAPDETVVDVGGGDAAFLVRLLQANPGVRGILLDLPGTVRSAADRITAAGLAGRAEARPGDFFAEVPPDGDCYLLSHVLHDWDDRRCGELLHACRAAMRPGTRLVVVDLLKPDSLRRPDSGYRAASMMDLYMLALFGDRGRERTAAEFAAVLDRAGLVVTRISRLPSGLGVLEAVRAD